MPRLDPRHFARRQLSSSAWWAVSGRSGKRFRWIGESTGLTIGQFTPDDRALAERLVVRRAPENVA